MSGFHRLFVPGPTNMPFGVRQAMSIPLEDQRSARSRSVGILADRSGGTASAKAGGTSRVASGAGS
jgi:aspartate aminotransferase-like enzyme